MVTIIACPDPTYATNLAQKSVKKDFPQRDEFNFASFNMAVTSPKEVAQEAEFLPLGTERKAIIAENCAFLQKPVRGQKKVAYEGLEDLQAFCENPADYTDLYLVVYDEKVDEKNPIVAAIKKNGHIILEKQPDEAFLRRQMDAFLQKRGCTISFDASKELLNRAGDNYAHFGNELKKLTTYANGENITLQMVESLVAKPLDDNVFALSEALLSGNVEKALSVYQDLKTYGQDEITLISLLSTSFRFLDEVAYLDSMGKGKREIAAVLGANEWRVGKTLQSLYGTKQEAIGTILDQLYDTAKAILSGASAPEFAFGRFLANFSLS